MSKFSKRIAFSAMAVALATVATLLPMPHMPMGGQITLFSMLFITLIGYWFGLGTGLACGVAFGLVQFIMDPYILSIPQVICDYFLAFGSLGLSGLFPNGKYKSILPGYITGVAGRYVFAVLSGVIFFASYAPDTGALSNPLLYSLVYNIIYIGAEAILTLVVISLPPVSKGLNTVKNYALS